MIFLLNSNIVYDIVYDIGEDIVYDVVYDITYDIVCDVNIVHILFPFICRILCVWWPHIRFDWRPWRILILW